MASDLSSRIAAILEKHPQLRPTCGDATLARTNEFFWYWCPGGPFPSTFVGEAEAHALIFRAMVEALPNGSEVFRTMYNQWTISGMGFWGDPNADLFDALCSYYEQLTPEAA